MRACPLRCLKVMGKRRRRLSADAHCGNRGGVRAFPPPAGGGRAARPRPCARAQRQRGREVVKKEFDRLLPEAIVP